MLDPQLNDIVVPPAANRVLEALGPGLASRAGALLAPLIAGYAAAAVDVDEQVTEGVVRRDGTRSGGWPDVFNLDRSPRPGWLGQFVGVRWIRSSTKAQQIAAVRSRGTTRGTPAAIRAAVEPYLTTFDGVGGTTTKRVRLRERTTTDGQARAYRFVVEVFAAQLDAAGTDEALLATIRAAVEEAKPVGLLFELRVYAGGTYADTSSDGQTYGQHTATGRTYAQRSRRIPPAPMNPTYADASATFRSYSDRSDGATYAEHSTPGGT